MEIEEFKERITKALTNQDEDGIAEVLEIYPAFDGSLSAKYRDRSIPCEGVQWDEALDIIVDFVESLNNG